MKIITAKEEPQEKKFLQVPFELKELGDITADSSIVSFKGYASTFNNKDLGRDVVLPGAFTETIKEGVAWPILHMHNSYNQIGWNAEALEDSKGLAVTGELNLAVQLAKEQYALAKHAKARGARMGLSIGYAPEVWEIDEQKRVRYLKAVKMYEYSFVVWPMNPKATVTQIKQVLEGLGCTDLKEYGQSARLMEGLLREVGLSVNEAKAMAGMTVRLIKGESLREVGSSPEGQELKFRELAAQTQQVLRELRGEQTK